MICSKLQVCRRTLWILPMSDDEQGWLVIQQELTRQIHIVPNFGRVHDLSHTCWCHPRELHEPGIPRTNAWAHELEN
jgi:hypothetical protein